jgi:hypothetical protein
LRHSFARPQRCRSQCGWQGARFDREVQLRRLGCRAQGTRGQSFTDGSGRGCHQRARSPNATASRCESIALLRSFFEGAPLHEFREHPPCLSLRRRCAYYLRQSSENASPRRRSAPNGDKISIRWGSRGIAHRFAAPVLPPPMPQPSLSSGMISDLNSSSPGKCACSAATISTSTSSREPKCGPHPRSGARFGHHRRSRSAAVMVADSELICQFQCKQIARNATIYCLPRLEAYVAFGESNLHEVESVVLFTT